MVDISDARQHGRSINFGWTSARLQRRKAVQRKRPHKVRCPNGMKDGDRLQEASGKFQISSPNPNELSIKEEAIFRTEGDISPHKQRIPSSPFHPQTNQFI